MMRRKVIVFCLMGLLILSGAACQQQKGNTTADSHAGNSIAISEDASSHTSDVSLKGSTDESTGDSSMSSDHTYRQITQEEAARMMETESGYIILDVRTQQEYDEGHIPQAVCIPNETIESDDIPGLPDKSQMIFVYCRSGRRSKEAAEKLASLGYTNIIEFGGIITWTGEITLD